MRIHANIRSYAKSVKIILALCAMLITGGCWDEVNLQDVSYISAIGVDYVDKHFVVYAQMISFGVIAKQEGAPPPGSPIWVGKHEGDTNLAAIFNLMDSSQYKLSLNHLKSVVIHERAFSEMQQIIDSLNRLSSTRFNCLVFGTKRDINDLFTMDMLFNKTPLTTPLYAPHIENNQNSYVEPLTLQTLVRGALEPAMTVKLPSLSLLPDDWENNKKRLNFLTIDGTFLFNEKKPAGFVSRGNSKGLIWTSEAFKRSLVPIRVEDKRGSVVVDSAKSNVKVNWEDGQPKFVNKVHVTGHLIEASNDFADQELIKYVEQVVQTQLKETYLKGLALNTDIYDLEHELYRYHNKAWRRLTKEEWKLSPKDLTIEVKCRIKKESELRSQSELDRHT
ncbi:Ger(x)C family spore germination protein [Paenibacillus glycanilyticus]|uniref:Ger(x)C family spore germination protein n=1 Tax=Paenibacillus glycanilyticus TaxID=126569 RepID=UPI00203CF31D|nr:Ger(x)C family spore germination protein [Paenibacillus glycanilyticus]MCM3628974.1 Ger(x)C family spore germination protein [Paenibacillus glycanilyticus]